MMMVAATETFQKKLQKTPCSPSLFQCLQQAPTPSQESRIYSPSSKRKWAR